MNDPKIEPAYGRLLREGDTTITTDGLTVYAEVAARFHAAALAAGRVPLSDTEPIRFAKAAFNHADAFFAELAKRTSS